jgi:cyclic pyranopterin monophosphate synthase
MTPNDETGLPMARPELTHTGPDGSLRMVDVGDKPVTERRAQATGAIRMQRETLELILANGVSKGDVFSVSRLAGIMAAKRTAEFIPLCHTLLLDDVQVGLEPDTALPGIRVTASVRTTGRTGAEMEAMTAVSVALLTIYDMAKGVDRGMVIQDIVLMAKSGGVSGEYARLDGTGPAR